MDLLGIGKPKRFIRVFVSSFLLFFIFTIPFTDILSVFTGSEVRFAAVLYPFLGINFGLPAALGIMLANLIGDIKNNYTPMILILGSFCQVLYAMIPRVVWRYFVRNDEHKHRLDSVKRVLQYAFVSFISAISAAAFVGFFCVTNFGLNFFDVAKFVFLNNFEVSIILGCPLMIVANQVVSRGKGIDRTVSVNEKIIIAAAIVEVVVLTILIITMYTSGKPSGTYDIWNTIYFYIVKVIALIFILTLIVMIACEKLIKKKS